ncbi:NAD(P)-dependent oxidoreductase [uncultured Zobellia sp.]|uniref:NAD(P)-dependent oxidoreductase n=1 Tax=uncultured Zobellia sp. TaxID=255433 RepID=UPI0025951053|nr:NAD(P)-dependent oxidoreductase [uncultured Zobellia sp.]
MKIAIFSCHSFEKKYIKDVNTQNHDIIFVGESLSNKTVDKAESCEAISVFSTDNVDREILEKLQEMNIKLIATRSAGTDHINLEAAAELDVKVANVPEYSPNAIAEHCIALTLALYRKLKPSFERIGNYNFSLDDQIGLEINAKTVGICGTGDIGAKLAYLFHSFGANVLLYDANKNADFSNKDWAKYVSKEILLEQSDIISLNLPLNDETNEFISSQELSMMKESAILINTGRGKLVNTEHIYNALQDNKIAGFAMDVYENEKGIFYKDLTHSKEKDKLLISLIHMKNVVVTAHQAFLTDTALKNMMKTTFSNIENFKMNSKVKNLVSNKE